MKSLLPEIHAWKLSPVNSTRLLSSQTVFWRGKWTVNEKWNGDNELPLLIPFTNLERVSFNFLGKSMNTQWMRLFVRNRHFITYRQNHPHPHPPCIRHRPRQNHHLPPKTPRLSTGPHPNPLRLPKKAQLPTTWSSRPGSLGVSGTSSLDLCSGLPYCCSSLLDLPSLHHRLK